MERVEGGGGWLRERGRERERSEGRWMPIIQMEPLPPTNSNSENKQVVFLTYRSRPHVARGMTITEIQLLM